MSERPCSPPDLQETLSRLCWASGSPSRSLVDGGLSPVFTVGLPASISTSSPLFTCLWVQISPLIKGLPSSGPQPIPMTSPTPLPLQRAHLQVRPHPQGRGSGPQRTLLETQVTHQRAWERSQRACKALSRVSVGAGFTAPGGYLLRCQGAFQALRAGLLPRPGTSRGGASRPSPARACREPQPLLEATGLRVPVILWVPPQPQDFLCPRTPILLRAELQVPTRDRRLGRGKEGRSLRARHPLV